MSLENCSTSAIVFFGKGLSNEEYRRLAFDGGLEAMLENGINNITSHVEELRLINKVRLACMATFHGSPDAIQQLKEYVEKEGIGGVSLDAYRPAVRAC
jgi:hypothetical protein